jgi:hypothetical protein
MTAATAIRTRQMMMESRIRRPSSLASRAMPTYDRPEDLGQGRYDEPRVHGTVSSDSASGQGLPGRDGGR